MNKTISLALCALLLIGGHAFAQQPEKKPKQAAPENTLPQGATVKRDIEYAKVGDKSLTLDLYLPDKEKKGGKPKLLVWIHGGGWRAGNKADCPLVWLVGEGYAVASISYRFSDVALFPAQIHDCKGAIRWLRAHTEEYRYDADRVGVSGESAGGHLVALLGTTADVSELEGETAGHLKQSSRVQAVVDFFGPTDFPKLAEQKHPEFVTSLVALLLGTPIATGEKQAKLASPVYHVTKDDAPLLIIQGDKDPLIFVPQSQALHDVYTKAGLESTLDVIAGGGHGGPPFFDAAHRAMIQAFFDKHIKTPQKK